MLKYVSDMAKHASEEPRDEINTILEYDFIIVGAGSAGCVVANRLTEVSECDVLLLEAGGEENYIMDIPILAPVMQFTDAKWNYKSMPSNKSCLGLTNRQCMFPRGKVMGGTSVLNFMVHTRGNRRDYDLWEGMGNTGWGYERVLPYFLRSEDIAIPELARNTNYHSTGGYLTVSYPPFHTPLAEAFLEAGKETGQRIIDYNAETQTGFSFLQTTTKNGTRCSASKAFLHPIRKRKNLHVKKRRQVTKILIDPSTKRAFGVEFIHNKKKYTVRARREVILAAGAINSPHLLMLSGIGPKKHLKDMNIPVIQDLKVGYNLMEHVGVIGLTFMVNQSVSLLFESLFENDKDLIEYFQYRTGPFSMTGGAEALTFFDSENPTHIDGYPDVELLFLGTSIGSLPAIRKVFGISDYVYELVYKPIEKQHSWMLVPIILRPKSRGRVKLSDNNPFHKPLIFPNFFEHTYDLEVLLKGVKKAVELSETNAFKKFGSKFHDTPVPGCESFVLRSDDYWRCMIRHLTLGLYHVSGTCKMGPVSDQEAVVDPRLRVHGINGLRVIDASVVPTIPSAHLNAPTIMIAEKGADLIKEDWGHKT
jgi:choline dehydrogenase